MRLISKNNVKIKNLIFFAKRFKKIIFSVIIIVFVLGYINVKSAGWNNTITWTTQDDFENNAVSTGTSTTATLVDTSDSGNVRLLKPNVTGETMALSNSHSLFVKEDGTLWATGRNQYGNFGAASYNISSTSVPIQINDDVASAVASDDNTFVIKKDGTLWVAGRNQSGTFGLGNTNSVSVWTKTSLTNIKQVATTSGVMPSGSNVSHTIALSTNGDVWRAGNNDQGQLATGNTTNITTWSKVSNANIIPDGNNKVESVAVGLATSYLVKTDGTVWVSGRQASGALGLGPSTGYLNVWTQTPLTNIVKVSVNFGHNAMALDTNGDVWVTGLNSSGSLGVGNTTQVNTWTKSEISGVIDISSGIDHSIALKQNGDVYAVGLGSSGALGLFGTTSRLVWTKVNVSNITNVFTGPTGSLLRKSDGSVLASGSNIFGQLGFANQTLYYGNWQKVDITNATKIASGSQTQYLVRNNTQLWAAGTGANGQIGVSPSTQQNFFVRTPTTDGTNIKKVVGGYLSSHMLYTDGRLFSTGYNGNGQLGFNNNSSYYSFTLATTITNVSDVATDYLHSIALKTDGTVWTTGYNIYGRLGLGDTTDRRVWTQATDSNSALLTDIKAIGAGYANSFAVKTNGDLWVSGYASGGQLGDGLGTNVSRFRKSNIINNIDKMWVGGNTHIIVQKFDGTLWAIGDNTEGALGLGDYVSRTAEWVQLDSSFNNPIDVSVSADITFIIKSDNTLWVTGKTVFGAMGTGNVGDRRNTFIKVADDALAIDSHTNYQAPSAQQSILLKKDGTVYTSGMGSYGQLGIDIANNGQNNNFEQVITNVKRSNAYYNPGTISNLIYDAGIDNIYKWNTISWSGETENNSQIKFRTRSANTSEALSSATWSDYYTVSGSKITSDNSRFLEIETTLYTSDGLTTPVLDEFSINYFTDITDPIDPSTPFNAWSSNQKTKTYTNNDYGNSQKPYFEFDGASDELGGSGIKGYYIYFGTSNTADPYTAGVYQDHVSGGPQTFLPANDLTTSGTYYLRVRTIDNAENKTDPITAFTYKYDQTAPISPVSINVTPFGWSRVNNFSFDYETGYDEALYDSGLLGYQYKFGGTSTDWSGEVLFTDDLTIADVEAYKNGQNIIYLRAIDKAGNTGVVRQAYFYYNGEAPSIPRNLTVNPQSSTTDNSFTFTWDLPESYNGDIKGYRYSINAFPQANNSTFINLSALPPEASYNAQTGRLTLSDIPAATLQGQNYFYIVAVDSNDNVAYGDNAARIGFDCTTPAPGAPIGLEIFDTSNRDQQKFSIALNWSEPTNRGVGFKDYVIERSTNGEDYTLAGTSAGNSFVNNGLTSRNYYYRVMTRDNSGNISTSSEIVSKIPTGRYTSPPVITVTPEVTAKVTTATVRWVTDRAASSFVVANETPDFDATKNQQGQQDNEVEHVVNLTGLKPDTSYYYRVVYTDSDGNSNVAIAENFTFKTLPAPRVERVSVQDVRLNTAIISWYTSEPAQSDLLYGKTNNYSSENNNVSGGATTAHTIRIDGLDHSSTYHFAIRIKDIDGNQIISDDYTFETLKFPKIDNVRFEALKDKSTSTFKITWTSNVPTNSIVKYQPEGGYLQEAVGSELKTVHEIIISNLLDNKYYHFNVYGVDQYGNQAVSETNRVKTDYDTRPPAIFNITSEVSSNEVGTDAKGQVVISWETDEPATSQVEYGLGSTGDNYEVKSQEDASLNTSHVVIINGLRPSSSYHFRVVSKDLSDNKSYSEAQSIITEQTRSSVLDIIMKSLQDSIGWLFGVN